MTSKINVNYLILFISLILFGITAILLKEYVNKSIGELYFFWTMIGGMILHGKKYPNKSVFWIVFPIMMWVYLCIGIHLYIKYPKTYIKRLILIYNE